MAQIEDSKTQTIGTALILALSQAMPSWIGYKVAAAISWVMANRVLDKMHYAVQQNQQVIHDGKLTRRQLRIAVRRVYQNQGRALYDFYHNLDRPEEIRKKVEVSEKFKAMMDECMSGKLEQGTMLLMPHLSGFNLSGLYLAQAGFKFLTLAIPNPNRGYRWQNKLRNDRGMEVVPMTMAALQAARQRLQSGGVVLTGIDRPHDDTQHRPLFFGRPAQLPVAYIKLALKTHARVFVVGFHTLPDHRYLIDLSDQVMLEEQADADEELIFNTQKVLRIAENFIRLDPAQWMMFLPVWPTVESEPQLL